MNRAADDLAGAVPWPSTVEELIAVQEQLARLVPPRWQVPADLGPVAACFVCFARGRNGPGAAGDRGWAAAALVDEAGEPVTATVRGPAGAPYTAGLLAMREGPLLEAALLALPREPALLVVNATGRDHPRRAGLALHLGVRLGVPSIGVTGRPLLAMGATPGDEAGARIPLSIAGEIVAAWVRTRPGTRPLVAHPGWRTDVDEAVELLLRLTFRWRTPLPLRLARQAARLARAVDAEAQGGHPGGMG